MWLTSWDCESGQDCYFSTFESNPCHVKFMTFAATRLHWGLYNNSERGTEHDPYYFMLDLEISWDSDHRFNLISFISLPGATCERLGNILLRCQWGGYVVFTKSIILVMIKPRVVLGGLVSEAWARSVGSYSRSLEYYNVRVKDGSQPSIPFINVFDVDKNTVLLCAMNSLYLIITFGIFWYMKRRQKGFQLRWLLVTYDALNVVIAAYIAISTLKYKLGHGGLLLCNPIATDAEGYSIANVFVLFYFQKYFEFFDTWFFLLRKSSRQVNTFPYP